MPHTDAATRESIQNPISKKTEPTPAEVCPYCGDVPGTPTRCLSCGAHTDPLSRQASQNEMGPWFVRDEARPFRPGCRLETIERWIRTGRVDAETVIRGPSTNQHWLRAGRVPGVARLLGRCHACQGPVEPTEVICGGCGAGLETIRDRQHLGLSTVRTLPGRHDPAHVAMSLLNSRPSSEASAHRATPPPPPAAEARRKPPADDVTRRVARLERQLKRANSRAMAGSVAAIAFAVLFALSMLFARSAETRKPAEEASTSARPEAVPPPAPVERSATETPAVNPDESIAESPDTTRQFVDELERLLASGGADDLEQAGRLIESAEAGGVPSDVVEKWRTRLEHLIKYQESAGLP